MVVDSLLHYGRVKWIGSDGKEGGGTVRKNLLANKGKKDNENEATLFGKKNNHRHHFNVYVTWDDTP